MPNENDYMFDDDAQLLNKERVDLPKMYKVLLHNDNYTTMDFVIKVLVTVFHMAGEEAAKVMLDVHKKGKGLCGIYTRDIAATKTQQVHAMARAAQFPLKCSYEEA